MTVGDGQELRFSKAPSLKPLGTAEKLNYFTFPGSALHVEFMRGPDGRVIAFTVSVGRAAEVEFIKR